MSYSDYESSSSEDGPSSSSSNLTPRKANELNLSFRQDCASVLNSLKKHIAKTKEKSLDMGNYGIGAAEVKSILEALINSDSKITDLSLLGNNFKNGTGDVFELLAETKLEKLDIFCSKLVKSDFMRLMEVLKRTRITHLIVAGNDLKLNENEASRFTSYLLASRLTCLDFEKNQFQPATGALSFIQALPHASITSLNLSQCHLHNDVLISLFSSIHLTSITELDVSFNKISDVQLQELCGNLKASKLWKLNLSNNDIQDAGMDLLGTGLVGSRVIALNIADNKFSGNNSFCSRLKNTMIKNVNFSGNRISHSKMFSLPQFMNGSSVEHLNINCCKLEDEVGQKLIRSLKFSNLEVFYAAGNRFGALSLLEFVEVANSTKLKDINLAKNKFLIPEFVTFVNCLKSTQLKFVNIACNRFYQSLKTVPLLLCSTEGSPIMSINVGNCDLFSWGIEAIANILAETKITRLFLYRNKLAGDVEKFACNLKVSSLTHLDLSDNKVKDAGAKALAKCLADTQIISLDISDNLITSQGAAALAESLRGSKLLHLNLKKNKIGNEGYMALTEGVKNTFITCLNVRSNLGNRILLIEKVLWDNRTSKAHLINFFKKIAPPNIGGHFCFDHVDDTNVDTFLDDALNFCKTLLEQPAAGFVLGEEETIPFSKTQIVDLMSIQFPGQFSVLIASKTNWDISEHLSFLSKVEDLGLEDVVKSLLWNRPLYTIDVPLGILHPYVYKLLLKYKQPLYNLDIEPEAKKKIISFFSKHEEYPDGEDIRNMLQ